MTDNVNERLKELRQWASFTQDQLAKRVNREADLGWYQSTVQRLESGEREPSLSDLKALGAIYGLTLDELVTTDPPAWVVADKINRGVANALRQERAALEQRIAEIDAELVTRTGPPLPPPDGDRLQEED